MKGTSKVIMGATLVMVVSLAMVLGLILVLLAELYCSLLLRRRQLRNTTATATTQTTANASPSQVPHSQLHTPPLPLTTIYAQGVLQAPRSFLFPAHEDMAEKPKKLHSHESESLHQVIQIQPQESNADPHHQIGLVSVSSPLTSFISRAPPKPIQEAPLQRSNSTSSNLCPDKYSCSGGGEQHLVYISNPIYENDESKASGANTPFETPDTSPSRLERNGSSGEDDAAAHSPPYTPPLSPMKKLPAEACSVSLRDARSLGTSGSDSHSNNGISSSSSGSPCTSPSW